MGEDLIRNVPPEIILDILSRLDACTAARGKCVCKLWLDLLTTPEFVKSHLSKSVSGLVVELKRTWFKFRMVEFVDGPRRLNIVFDLLLPFCGPIHIHSSTNGLILWIDGCKYGPLTLCNPITREYITFRRPQLLSSRTPYEIYGFGVSRTSGQYKVVRISAGNPQRYPGTSKSGEHECHVYTVGSGSWRRLATCWSTLLPHNSMMTFLRGNLHRWTRKDDLSPRHISRLDLETEVFSTLSEPPCADRHEISWDVRHLCTSSDCLCVCDDLRTKIDIWVMKVYEDEKSWTKEVTIRKADIVGVENFTEVFYPIIRVYRNGDMLMVWKVSKPLYYYYSSATKTIEKVDWFDPGDFVLHRITYYTPSFLSLKTFAAENVTSF